MRPDIITNHFDSYKDFKQWRRELSIGTLNKEYLRDQVLLIRGKMNDQHHDEVLRRAREHAEPLDNRSTICLRYSSSTLIKYVRFEALYAQQHGPYIVLDMDYRHLMSVRERTNTVKQILDAMGYNLQMKNPFFFHLTGVGDSPEQQFKRFNDITARFEVNATAESYLDLFPREQLVYLSPDAPVELQHFDPNLVYIVGGLVDKKFQVRESFSRAREQKIKMARIPLDTYLP